MKNFKKVLALVLAFAMVLSSMTISFAAEATLYATQTEADALYDLGLFKGMSTTEKELNLEGELTREMAMKLMADIFGWELAGDSEYTDVAVWAQPAVAAAVANGITNGIGEGQFGGKKQATGIEVTTWFLRALGYDQAEAYEKAAELGMEAGIIELNDALTLKDASLRGMLTKVAYNTLKSTPVGEDLTIAEKLIEAGTIDEDDALALGLVSEEVPEVLAVEEINTLNLIQIEVIFNGEVDKDSAEDVDNYSLTDIHDEEDDAEVIDAELLEDGKTVILTLKDAADQQDEVDVTVKNVEDLAENKIEETTVEDIELIDQTIPTVVDAEVVGNDTIKITFSEPVEAAELATDTKAAKLDKNGFEVNDGDIHIKEARLQNNNTEALVELYSDLKEGETTIVVDNTTLDYAGFGVIKETFTLSVVEDNEAPVVIGYEDATPNGVTLIWSEDIELKDGDEDNFYHTNSNNKVDADIVVADIDGNKLTLDFTDDNLPEGSAYVYVLKESVNDLWDNENAQEMFKVEVVIDVTAPEVDGDIDFDTEDTCIIKFTEELDEDSAEEEDNYTLLDSEGKEVKDIFDDFTYDAEDDELTINFEEDLNGDYTLVIKDVEDLVGNVIADTTIDFNVEDLTKPVAADDFTAKIYKAGLEGQMIRIDFGEKMATEGKYSVLDLENYTIDGNVLADLDIEPSITLVNDGKAVEIEITCEVEDEDGIDFDEDSVIIASRLADAAGNYTDLLSNIITLDDQGHVSIDSAVAMSTTEVKVTFTDESDKFDDEEIVITTDKSTKAKAIENKLDIDKIKTTINGDGNTVAVFTIDEDETEFDFDLATSIYAYVIDNDSENKYGEDLVIGDFKAASDEIAPELAIAILKNENEEVDYVTSTTGAVAGTNSKITLKFTEAIKKNTISTLTFEVEKCEVTSVDTDGNDVILYVIYDGTDDYTLAPVETKVTQNYAIEDIEGNEIKEIKTEVTEKDNIKALK